MARSVTSSRKEVITDVVTTTLKVKGTDSVSEIEFCTPYVVTERWIWAACCASCTQITISPTHCGAITNPKFGILTNSDAMVVVPSDHKSLINVADNTLIR